MARPGDLFDDDERREDEEVGYRKSDRLPPNMKRTYEAGTPADGIINVCHDCYCPWDEMDCQCMDTAFEGGRGYGSQCEHCFCSGCGTRKTEYDDEDHEGC